ncbi:virulence factor MviN [[Clostridium] sordellii]|uniref:murein biosynthesis integral membrane protein MurJ n=1 Tax=Paraclostridium sordellii TaxID=1505 RepID=UPI0005DC3524|nr:murein biosynthesis integral membrane protein MurJ [Paeniclostridium sordellii]CEP47852.1 virulence factor MviN [[Clostridium] sordellii] [Paeniclostridium sordellii]
MNKVTKATIGLMIATIISKILGFGRELVLGSIYGTSIYSDAYIVSMNIPNVIFASIGAAIATTFIPLYHENKKNSGEEKALEFTNNIINIVTVISIVVAIFILIFTEPIVKIFAIGFKGEALSITVKFTKIMIFGILFIGLTNIFRTFLNIKGEFIIPGLTGIPFNIIIILSIILSYKINPIALAIGTLIAMGSECLFQIPFAFKHGYKYTPKINFNDDNLKKIIWLTGPVFIGIAVNQVNAMVDRTLASTLVEGSIAALNYANRLNGFVLGLFITSISSVIYPMLSKLSIDKNLKEFKNSVLVSVNTIILIIIPISIGAIIFSKPIVSLLFERGAFDSKATQMTSTALAFYSIGMIGFGLRDILGKVFYSLKDTKTPMVNGAIAMILNIFLNIILIRYMGHAGLAFATSISSIACIVLLFISLNKKIGYFGQDKIIKTLVKSLISAIVMGLLALACYNLMISILGIGFITKGISLGISVLIGVIVYGALIMFLKVEEVNVITKMIKKIK